MRRASEICPLMYWHLSVKSSPKVDHIHNDATNMNQNRKVADFRRLLNERQFQMSASVKSWSKLWHAFLKTEYFYTFLRHIGFFCVQKYLLSGSDVAQNFFTFPPPSALQCAVYTVGEVSWLLVNRDFYPGHWWCIVTIANTFCWYLLFNWWFSQAVRSSHL